VVSDNPEKNHKKLERSAVDILRKVPVGDVATRLER
jgi:hypothetical protein